MFPQIKSKRVQESYDNHHKIAVLFFQNCLSIKNDHQWLTGILIPGALAKRTILNNLM